jgi:hypothetical protein
MSSLEPTPPSSTRATSVSALASPRKRARSAFFRLVFLYHFVCCFSFSCFWGFFVLVFGVPEPNRACDGSPPVANPDYKLMPETPSSWAPWFWCQGDSQATHCFPSRRDLRRSVTVSQYFPPNMADTKLEAFGTAGPAPAYATPLSANQSPSHFHCLCNVCLLCNE